MVIYRSDFEPSPERIRAIQLYLADLIKEVDTLDPRDFEAATAKGEGWATTMSFAIFLAVDRLESCLFPYSEPRVNSWPGRRIGMSIWPMYAIAAVERLLAVTEVLIMRWRAPEFCTKLRTAKGDDPELGDDPDDGTRYPVIEIAELAALRKINVDLIRAWADADDEFPAEGGDKGAEGSEGEEPWSPEPDAVEQESEGEERPVDPPIPGAVNLVLGDVGERPLIWGVTVNPVPPRRHKILKALLDAGPKGLSLEQLIDKTKEPRPDRILADLLRDYPMWRTVVQMPGKSWTGYRLYRVPPGQP